MQRHSGSLAIQEVQIKTTVKYDCTPIRTAKHENRDYPRCRWGCRNIAAMNVKQHSHSGKDLSSFFSKITHATTIQLRNCSPGHPSHRNENFCSHRSPDTSVQSSCVCNSQKLETAQRPFLRWLFQPMAVRPCHRILLSSKKEGTIPWGAIRWVSREVCWVRKANPKGHTHSLWLHLYSVLEMTNYGIGEQRMVTGVSGGKKAGGKWVWPQGIPVVTEMVVSWWCQHQYPSSWLWFARCYNWRNLGEMVHGVSLNYCSQRRMNL